MESGDSEYEEEEVVVLAELIGLVDDELLRKGCTYQFVGIDTDKPVLQLGKYNFLGSYEDQIGSALFLKESTDEEGQKTWSKLCFSDKKLAMQRVFLRKKGEEATAMEQDAAAAPEPALGREPGKEQETESGLKPDPSAVADEKQPEQDEKRPKQDEKRPDQDEKRPEQDEKRPEQDEKRPEQAVDAESATAASPSSAAASSPSAAATAAADEVSSDVDMPPAKGTETAPSEAQSSANNPSSASEH